MRPNVRRDDKSKQKQRGEDIRRKKNRTNKETKILFSKARQPNDWAREADGRIFVLGFFLLTWELNEWATTHDCSHCFAASDRPDDMQRQNEIRFRFCFIFYKSYVFGEIRAFVSLNHFFVTHSLVLGVPFSPSLKFQFAFFSAWFS